MIRANQTEKDGATTRNDRLIAVASDSYDLRHIEALEQLNQNLVDEIQHFFVSYNMQRGRKFEPLGQYGPERTRRLLDEAVGRRQHPPQDGRGA